jgi:hypothetical protein
LKYIESLIDGYGEITIGRAGPIRCAAIACDEDQQLAALVRRPKESLEALLKRLDLAIKRARERDEFADEINGGGVGQVVEKRCASHPAS